MLNLFHFFDHPSGNTSEPGQQEAAPRGGVPGPPGPAARGGGQPERRSASPAGDRGRGPQHQAALGRRPRRAGNQALHLGGGEAHRVVEQTTGWTVVY